MSTIPVEDRLRITEVYASIQGESTHVGKPCVFIRLTGCNLRCRWCDSSFTFTGGEYRSIEDILLEVHQLGIHTVEVTGGEPLVQRNVIRLMQGLIDLGHEVLLETSGSRSIAEVPPEVHIILDLKPPDSGEERANLWDNLPLLKPKDEVKFVIASRRDYEWAKQIVERESLQKSCPVLFSPVWETVEPQTLIEWILADRLLVRFQLQIHKVIWPPNARGV